MHYFQFNIGDYASHTRHLTPTEDLAYRRLLDAYYLHERPLNVSLTSVARQLNLRDFEKDIQSVLEEFFVLTDDGWVNFRADKEIAAYKAKSQQASRAGKASAEARLNKRSTDVQPNIKQETINIKQKTENNKILTPDGVTESTWDAFVLHRKTSKSVITETVIKSIKKEADKAGWTLDSALLECVMRGWRGFKAEWVADKPKTTGYESVKDKSRREAMEGLTGKRNYEFIDIN